MWSDPTRAPVLNLQLAVSPDGALNRQLYVRKESALEYLSDVSSWSRLSRPIQNCRLLPLKEITNRDHARRLVPRCVSSAIWREELSAIFAVDFDDVEAPTRRSCRTERRRGKPELSRD